MLLIYFIVHNCSWDYDALKIIYLLLLHIKENSEKLSIKENSEKLLFKKSRLLIVYISAQAHTKILIHTILQDYFNI
jgi:hypothetical protein